MTETGADNVLDLDAARKARAAAREGRGDGLPIILGGQTIAVLPAELPLDVLAPLRTIEADITLLVRQVMRSAQSNTDTSQTEMVNLIVDLLATNPDLPSALVDITLSVGTGLLGEDGMAALKEQRLTREDAGVLIKGILDHFGVSLGESSEPSESPEGSPGETSNTTSSTTSDSTPDGSGSEQETPTSLASVGS